MGFAQFYQMHLSFQGQAKNTAGNTDFMAMQMAAMGKVMKYVMPVFIVILSLTLPSAIALYWLVSTVFAIGQQVVINNLFKDSNGDALQDGSDDTSKKKKNKKKEKIEDITVVPKKK